MRFRSSAFHNKLEWVLMVLEDQLSTELDRGVPEPNLRYGRHNACRAFNRVSRTGWRQPFKKSTRFLDKDASKTGTGGEMPGCQHRTRLRKNVSCTRR